MGYIRHHAIIVTTWDIEKLQPAADYAAFLGMTTSPPVASPLNGYVTMLIAPDGSKEGWDASDSSNGSTRSGTTTAQHLCDGLRCSTATTSTRRL